MKKIVFITTRNLFPTDSGDKVLSLNMIKKLSQDNKIILINVLDSDVSHNYMELLNGYTNKVHIIYPLKQSFFRIMYNTILLCPFMIAKRRVMSIRSEINSLLLEKYSDYIVIWDHLRSSAFIELKTKKQKYILIEHNNEVAIIENMINNSNSIVKPLLILQKILMKNYLKRLYKKLDRIVYISSYDMDDGQENKKYYLLNNLPIEFNHSDVKYEVNNGNKLLFVGSLDWFPNVIGIKWFVTNVLPLLKEFNIEFHIVGRNPSKEMYALISDNIYLHENVPSVEEYYHNSDIFIVPIFDGAGINIKLLEALSFNIPIVATSFALRGYNGLEFLNPTDDAASFKEEIVKLLTENINYKNRSKQEHDYYNNYIQESISELNKIVTFT